MSQYVSFTYVRPALHCHLPLTDKNVLVHLAKYANEDGECSPSQEVLAEEAGMCSRTIRRAIRRLLVSGAIQQVRRGNRFRSSNIYRLDLAKINSFTRESYDQVISTPDTESGVTPYTGHRVLLHRTQSPPNIEGNIHIYENVKYGKSTPSEQVGDETRISSTGRMGSLEEAPLLPAKVLPEIPSEPYAKTSPHFGDEDSNYTYLSNYSEVFEYSSMGSEQVGEVGEFIEPEEVPQSPARSDRTLSNTGRSGLSNETPLLPARVSPEITPEQAGTGTMGTYSKNPLPRVVASEPDNPMALELCQAVCKHLGLPTAPAGWYDTALRVLQYNPGYTLRAIRWALSQRFLSYKISGMLDIRYFLTEIELAYSRYREDYAIDINEDPFIGVQERPGVGEVQEDASDGSYPPPSSITGYSGVTPDLPSDIPISTCIQ